MKDEKKPSINFRKLISRLMMVMMAWRFLKNRGSKNNIDSQKTNV
jgi:hypothetical protein